MAYALLREVVRISLFVNDPEFNFDAEDTEPLIDLIAIYLGFGNIIANANESYIWWEGLKQESWNHFSLLPNELEAFAYATSRWLQAQVDEDDVNESHFYPSNLLSLCSKAYDHIELNPSEVFNLEEIRSLHKFDQATEFATNGQLEKANEILKKLTLENIDPFFKADILNFLGYNLSLLGDYNSSELYLMKALQEVPDFAFALANLGYVHLMKRNLEKAKSYIDKSQNTNEDHPAYTYRNLAIYHELTGDTKKAQKYYQKAYSENEEVDLLDFHYGKFLIKNGDPTQGKKYLESSAGKNELTAIKYLKELNLSNKA